MSKEEAKDLRISVDTISKKSSPNFKREILTISSLFETSTRIKNFHLHGPHWIEKNYPNTPNHEEFLFVTIGDKFFIFPVVMTIQK